MISGEGRSVEYCRHGKYGIRCSARCAGANTTIRSVQQSERFKGSAAAYSTLALAGDRHVVKVMLGNQWCLVKHDAGVVAMKCVWGQRYHVSKDLSLPVSHCKRSKEVTVSIRVVYDKLSDRSQNKMLGWCIGILPSNSSGLFHASSQIHAPHACSINKHALHTSRVDILVNRHPTCPTL
ncbi:hypothetical protein T440DRAFT_142223 [Plenodomus tracheiphilus IPT5]|uniref:Uncharacterized protein n=1 Tax=Plenodomus tracheiphilus IPT5 TaxID=1408161 RepID=A0A6A7B0X7_9PLEO|nr:hypothetical protein T440DRAFT_142223 [Plenodomus tracheiphilus IPT5]